MTRTSLALACASSARFIVNVTGHIDGEDVTHAIPLATVPHDATMVAAFIYHAVTGNRLILRRLDWNVGGLVSGSRSGSILRLYDSKGVRTGRVEFLMSRAPEPAPAPEIAAPVAGNADAVITLAYEDVALATFDRAVNAGMKTPLISVREIRRAAMGAAIAAVLALGAGQAQASEGAERASFLSIVAQACGIPAELAQHRRAPRYLAQWGAKHAATFADRKANAPELFAADCAAARLTIETEGEALGFRRVAPVAACETDSECEAIEAAGLGKPWTASDAPADGMTRGAIVCVFGRPAKVAIAPVPSGKPGFDAVLVAYTHGKAKGVEFYALHKRGSAVEFAPRCAGRGF